MSPVTEASWAESACWLYTILVDADEYGCDRFALFRLLIEKEIQARPLWRPLHLQPAFQRAQTGPVSVAERLYARGLSLPCSVGITPEERQDVVDAVVQRLS